MTKKRSTATPGQAAKTVLKVSEAWSKDVGRGIARIDPTTFRITMLAKSPVSIAAAGDILDGRIYFASGSHMYSYAPE